MFFRTSILHEVISKHLTAMLETFPQEALGSQSDGIADSIHKHFFIRQTKLFWDTNCLAVAGHKGSCHSHANHLSDSMHDGIYDVKNCVKRKPYREAAGLGQGDLKGCQRSRLRS